MTDAAWEQVERIFSGAVDLPRERRSAFLESRCAGDAALRSQMDSLLAAHDALVQQDARAAEGQAGVGFLATLDPSKAGAILNAPPGPENDEGVTGAAGRSTVGRYELVRQLGRGGMGVVYLARDPTLERPVAIKLLNDPAGTGLTANRRFLHEARAASALDHPNIGTVFEVGEVDDTPYIAMAYYDGATLRQRIAENVLPVEEAVGFASQVADGLRAAHASGIIHRDIKPENLIVAPHGLVKIVDFGVASYAAHTLTRHDGALGTVAYMSPEQSRGGPSDHRTDIWSLGVVLYEMLTGTRPFQGEAPEVVIFGIRNDPPTPVGALRPEVPPALAEVVDRCLQKDPERRFADVAALGDALRAALASTGGGSPAARRPAPMGRPDGLRGRRRRRGAALVGTAVLLFAVTGLYLGTRSPAMGSGSTVVLADLTSEAVDAGTAHVVTEALRIDLLQSPAFRLADAGEVAEALRRMGRDPEAGVPESAARELALRDGYEAVIAGEVGALGGGYVLTSRIVATGDGSTVAAFRETARDPAGLIDAVDRLSKRIREEVGEPLRTLRRAEPLPRVATASLPALRRYAEASRLAWSGADQARIARLLEETIALDPEFAAAHRGLAVSYWNLRADRSRIVDATRAAFELRDRLSERERYLVEAAYHWQVLGDPGQTAEAYRRVLEIEPDDMTARNNLGLALLFDGEPAEAERVLRAGAEPLPTSDLPELLRINLARALYFQGRTDEALAVIDSTSDRPGGSPAADVLRVRVLGGDHHWNEAEAAAGALIDEHGAVPAVRAEALRSLWHLALARGRLADAEVAYGEMETLLGELGADDALARAIVQRAEVRRTLWDDPDGARDILGALLQRDDLDLFSAGATLVPRAAAALAGAGDTATAARLLDRWEAQPDEAKGDPDTFSPELARARMDLASGRADRAVLRLRSASAGTIQAIHYLPDLSLAHRSAGEPDSAIAVLERYLDFRHTRRLHRLAGYLGPAFLSLAELHEEAGDTAAALSAHARLVELWSDADDRLQPQVEHARGRITELSRRER